MNFDHLIIQGLGNGKVCVDNWSISMNVAIDKDSWKNVVGSNEWKV